MQNVTNHKTIQVVEEIAQTFGLIEEELLQVSRVKNKYELIPLSGTNAEALKPTFSRIFDLYMIARDWKTTGLSSNAHQLHTPILDNQSIFDLLREEFLDKERILFAGSRLSLLSKTQTALIDPFA